MFPLENIPYKDNRFFTDREDLRERIRHDFLSRPRQEATFYQALTGPIGIGKTQVALVYAQHFAKEYQARFWFDATTDRTLYNSVVSLAELLKLPQQDRSDEQSLYQAVKRWLQSNDRWLLVLDNLTNMAFLDWFIPARSHGHVLITTLRQTLELFIYPIPISSMDQDDCLLFLLYRAGKIDTPTAQFKKADYSDALAIIDETDGISLALDQAGAYIEQTCWSLEKYLGAYRRDAGKLLALRGQDGYTHEESLQVAISLTLEKVADESPEALTLLRLFAFLQRDAIPTDLLADGKAALDGPLRALTNEDQAAQAISVLRQFSLIQHVARTNTFTINRVIQTIVYEKIPKKERRLWARRVVRLISTIFPSVAFETLPLCEKYLIQAKECAHLIEQIHLVEDEAAQLLLCLGTYRYECTYYQEAEQYFQQALQICQTLAEQEELAYSEHRGIPYALNSLALLCHTKGQYHEAETLFLRALELRESTSELNHHAIAQTRNNLANLYKDQGRLQEAVELLRRAIEIDVQALGSNHPETARFISNLAFLYDELGFHKQAETSHQQVYEIVSQALPTGHPDIALSLNALATNAEALGDYQRAEALFREAISQRELYLGDDHPDTAQSLNNLAHLYTSQARYQEAEMLYHRVLAICECTLGPEHPLTATVLTNSGWLYHLIQQDEIAEDYLRRGQAINEQISGKDTLDTYKSTRMFACLLIDQQRYEEARHFSQRSLHICQQRYGLADRRTREAQEQHTSLLQRIYGSHHTANYQEKPLMQDAPLEPE